MSSVSAEGSSLLSYFNWISATLKGATAITSDNNSS